MEKRKSVRTCNNIFKDTERIAERYSEALRLEEESKMKSKHKNKNDLTL